MVISRRVEAGGAGAVSLTGLEPPADDPAGGDARPLDSAVRGGASSRATPLPADRPPGHAPPADGKSASLRRSPAPNPAVKAASGTSDSSDAGTSHVPVAHGCVQPLLQPRRGDRGAWAPVVASPR